MTAAEKTPLMLSNWMISNGRYFDIRHKVSVEHPNSIEVSLVQLIENGIEETVYKYRNTETDDDQNYCISALVSDDILITKMFNVDDKTQSQSLLQCHDLKRKRILWAKRIFVTGRLKIIGNGLLIGHLSVGLEIWTRTFHAEMVLWITCQQYSTPRRNLSLLVMSQS